MSPTPPAGSRFRRAPIPLTEMMYRFRAPELSAQFMIAPLFRVLVSNWVCGRGIGIGSLHLHRQTEGHLELATGGTTPVKRNVSIFASESRCRIRIPSSPL